METKETKNTYEYLMINIDDRASYYFDDITDLVGHISNIDKKVYFEGEQKDEWIRGPYLNELKKNGFIWNGVIVGIFNKKKGTYITKMDSKIYDLFNEFKWIKPVYYKDKVSIWDIMKQRTHQELLKNSRIENRNKALKYLLKNIV